MAPAAYPNSLIELRKEEISQQAYGFETRRGLST